MTSKIFISLFTLALLCGAVSAEIVMLNGGWEYDVGTGALRSPQRTAYNPTAASGHQYTVDGATYTAVIHDGQIYAVSGNKYWDFTARELRDLPANFDLNSGRANLHNTLTDASRPSRPASMPSTSRGGTYSVLSGQDRTLVSSTTDRNTLKVYVDQDNQVHVRTSAEAAPRGAVEITGAARDRYLSNTDAQVSIQRTGTGTSATISSVSLRTQGKIDEGLTTSTALSSSRRVDVTETIETRRPTDITAASGRTVEVISTRTDSYTCNGKCTDPNAGTWTQYRPPTETYAVVVRTPAQGDRPASSSTVRSGFYLLDNNGGRQGLVTTDTLPNREAEAEYRTELASIERRIAAATSEETRETLRERKEDLEDRIERAHSAPETSSETLYRTAIRDSDGRVTGYVDADGTYLGTDFVPLDEDELKQEMRNKGIPEAQIDTLIERAERERAKQGASNPISYCDLAGGRQCIVGALKEYEALSGLNKLSSLFMGDFVSKNRERLAQEFCLGAGIENCLVSTICGSIHEIKADNVLIGRAPSGAYVQSASLSAERGEPVPLVGLSRQNLIDILGNSTSIGGQSIDLQKADFDPAALGQLNLRLYKVQFSITNNARYQEKLYYNLEFRRTTNPQATVVRLPVPASIEEFDGDLAQFNRNLTTARLGVPLSSARYYPKEIEVAPLKTETKKETRYSTNEWDTVCLVFQPGLPKGDALDSGFVREFCRPIVEYAGGATSIAPPPGANVTRQNATTTPSRPTTPGVNV